MPFVDLLEGSTHTKFIGQPRASKGHYDYYKTKLDLF